MKRITPTILIAATWLLASSFTIHLMGDSTMAEKNLPKAGAERGWGMMLQNFLDPDGAKVINYAQNGVDGKVDFRQSGFEKGASGRAFQR